MNESTVTKAAFMKSKQTGKAIQLKTRKIVLITKFDREYCGFRIIDRLPSELVLKY